MYHVSKFDESRFAVPQGYESHSHGYERASLVDHTIGSVHTGALERFRATRVAVNRRHACGSQLLHGRQVHLDDGRLYIIRAKQVGQRLTNWAVPDDDGLVRE